jgi:hypothetical protein
VKDLPDSALTGRTMEQIARDAEEVARRERLARKPA